MSIELAGKHDELQYDLKKEYCSPEDALVTHEAARRTLRKFLHLYVTVSKIKKVDDAGAVRDFSHEMFTGYGGLGELVHIRVDPFLADAKEGYFVATGNIHTGEVGEPAIRHVERFQDNAGTRQTIIYFEDESCDEWPPEYHPMIHFAQSAFRFAYKLGFGQGESLLRPISTLVKALNETAPVIPLSKLPNEPMNRRALELVEFSE